MILKNGKRIDGCSDTVPVGTLNPFLGLTPPAGYLICQGQLVSKQLYPELYAICGDTFGTATATEFYLPDLRGKTITGYKEGDSTFGTLGALIGDLSHMHSTGNHTLTINEIPSHTHKTTYSEENGVGWESYRTGNSTIKGSKDYLIAPAGGSGAHNHGDTSSSSSLQPSINLNWIVKAVMLIPVNSIVENNLMSTSTTNALSAAQGKILNTNKQDKLISGTNLKTINNESLLGEGNIEIGKSDGLPINSIIEYDGDTIPEGYEIYTDYTTTVQKTLFETTSWGSMMQRFETKSIDFSSYDYVEVEFTGQGGTNATNTILKIDLHQPVKTTMTNDGISYKYGASICFPDIQLLQGANNDPGIFRIGACISTAKDRIWMGDPGYFSGQTSSGNFDTNSTYNRISKIVGFKFVQKLKKTFQGTLPDNKIVNTYSVSQTDTYSCDYINKNTSYSTTEINTGQTWIDGKPIYRKVISTTVTLEYGVDTDIAHGISNLDQVIDIRMLGVPNANGIQFIFPYVVANKASFTNPVFVSRTNITVRTYQDSWSSGVKIFVLEYTKTTD